MAKKKGIINNEDKMIELTSANKTLDKMKSLEGQRINILTRLNIANGYVMTSDKTKWGHKTI